MKSILLVLLLGTFVLNPLPSDAQNLVHNGGFEVYTNNGGIYIEDNVPHWFAYFSTPDYYSTVLMGEAGLLDYCGTLPHGGKGMAGGYQYGYFPDIPGYNREYIQGVLTEPLKKNTLYYAEMYVKPMLKSPVINFGINRLGIALTGKHYTHMDSTHLLLIETTPEVAYSGAVITDRTEWTKISGCFLAEGGETKIIIGNFNKDADTDTAQIPGAFGEEIFHLRMSYYLFDDILVREIQAPYIEPGNATICRDSTIRLSAYPQDAITYRWPDGSTEAFFQTAKAGTYTVSITSKEGCTLEASATIKIKSCGKECLELEIPNAFSPNNDGINDYFQPAQTEEIQQVEWSIYNRMGQRIFYCTDLNKQWDGRFHENTCDAGTYFYYCHYRDCKGRDQHRKGDVTLLR